MAFQDGAEESVRGGSEGSKEKHTLTDDGKRTCRGMAKGAVTDGLAMDTAFLGGEREGSVVSFADAEKWGCSCIESGVAKREGDVAKMEGVGFGVGPALAILPGWRRKKKAMTARLVTACCRAVAVGSWTTGCWMWWRSWSGTDCVRVGGWSFLL
jgi:hypothetical protein